MNGFIVLGTLHGYDVPLAMFDSRDAAEMFADDVTAEEVHDALLKAWRGQLDVEASARAEPLGVVLCELRDCEPLPFEWMKNFDEPEASK